jgi:DNA-binding response OmpR family regulator
VAYFFVGEKRGRMKMAKINYATILVVEDEITIRRFIVINLERNGYKVLEASTGEEALEIIWCEKPDLVILDLMLPGIDGFEVCRRLRKNFTDMAVIMLTARGQDTDKVLGLELGADDYVVKPFNPFELVARVRAVLRRIRKRRSNSMNILRTGPFQLDLNSQSLFKSGREIDLTPREFNLIKIFIENRNKAINRDDILNLAWGQDFIGDPKTVDVHVRRLREKLEDDPSNPKFVETVWGYGYRWREEA